MEMILIRNKKDGEMVEMWSAHSNFLVAVFHIDHLDAELIKSIRSRGEIESTLEVKP